MRCGAQNRVCLIEAEPPFKLCCQCRAAHRANHARRKADKAYRERCRAYAAKYNRSKKGHANELRRVGRDRQKVKARSYLNHAVRDGRATRLPCEVCGDPNSQGHHHVGYDRHNWLNVRWLCGLHHREEERIG